MGIIRYPSEPANHAARYSLFPTPYSLFLNLAGAEGFEPPSSVLETDSLTVELTPLKAGVSDQLSEVSWPLPSKLTANLRDARAKTDP